MGKGVKINKARFLIFIIVVILVIALIVCLVKNLGKDKNNITLDGTIEMTEDTTITNSQDIEYDGNPYSVPQEYTQTVNEFVGEDGDSIDTSEISTIEANIEEKFKSVSTDKLGIDTDISNVSIVFNQVTTTIAGKNCLVFAVYAQSGDELNFVSKYAMSIDTSVLYKFDSSSLVYNMIEM